MKPPLRNFFFLLLLAAGALTLGTAHATIITSGTASWTGAAGGDWTTESGWSSSNVAATGGGEQDPPIIYPVRVNINNGNNPTLIYSADQGHTIYTGVNGRVFGSSSNAGGSMTITGGIFESRATAAGADFIGFNGNNSGTWVLTVDGGTYISMDNGANFRLGYTGGNQTVRLDIKGGNFTAAGIRWGWNASSTGITGTINLDGGVLTTGSLAESNTNGVAINSTINFNGGTLRARSNTTSFITATAIDAAKVLSKGAIIDTNGFNITIAKGLTEDGSSTGGGLTKQGGGTLTLSGDNEYTGETVVMAGTLLVNGSLDAASDVSVTGGFIGGNGTIAGSVTVGTAGGMAPGASVGTLTIGGDLDISAMAAGTGKLAFELATIATSDHIAVAGSLDIGSGVLGFSDFTFSDIGGLAAGTYPLITSGTLSGTLNPANLEGKVGANHAELQISGNIIELVVKAIPSATLVIDLGAGTQIPGGAFGTFGALNLPIEPLPIGSILRSVEVDAVLTATDNDNYASDFAILFDPTPASPGDDFAVVMTNGVIKFGAPVQLGWPEEANNGPPTPLTDTKSAAAWSAAGNIDLATTGIFLGNAFNKNADHPGEGGTWSGTITLTYDLVAPGNAYDTWAAANAPTGDPDGDFDGDGVANAVEFVLGGEKNTNDIHKLPAPGSEGGNFTFTFVRDQASIDPSVAVVIAVGTDLAEWPLTFAVGADTADSSAGVTVLKGSPVEGMDTVTLAVPQDPDTRKFAQLRVTVTP